jgi:hypothetical protein
MGVSALGQDAVMFGPSIRFVQMPTQWVYVAAIPNTSHTRKHFAQNSWPSIVINKCFRAHRLALWSGTCPADLCWRHTHPQQRKSPIRRVDVRWFQVTQVSSLGLSLGDVIGKGVLGQ